MTQKNLYKWPKKRIKQHKSNYINWINGGKEVCGSFKILENNDWEYETIEKCDIRNIRDREKFHIRNHLDNCVNIVKYNSSSHSPPKTCYECGCKNPKHKITHYVKLCDNCLSNNH